MILPTFENKCCIQRRTFIKKHNISSRDKYLANRYIQRTRLHNQRELIKMFRKEFGFKPSTVVVAIRQQTTHMYANLNETHSGSMSYEEIGLCAFE